MRRVLFATINIILLLTIFSACSKDEFQGTPEKVYISVVFTPEGFCNMGYNDSILMAIETLSQKYGYEYSFSIPDTIEDGMAYYNAWCNTELDDNTRCLFIFASNLYEEYLADATHISDNPRRDVLIFEVEKELPYAYTFAMTYYGASYMIGSYYLSNAPADFQIIAANPYLDGLNYVIDGLTRACEESAQGSVNVTHLDNSPTGGLDDANLAFIACKQADYSIKNNFDIFVPYAGLSNLGIYRFSESNHRITVGVDCIVPDLYSHTYLCMSKHMDLALDNFLELWIQGQEPPKHIFYTLELGVVSVDVAKLLEEDRPQLDSYLKQAIDKEKTYFREREANE